MRRRQASAGWDLLAAYSNPVPGDLPGALAALGIDPVRIVDQNGAQEVLARCPMHKALTGREDRNPSFWVNADSGVFICFSCHYTGTFVQLVCDARHVDRLQAVRWIAAQGIYRTRSNDDIPAKTSGPKDTPPITEAALALFVPPAATALEERRLSAEACADYGVLWDPGRHYWILPIREPLTGTLLGWQEKGRRHFINYPSGISKSRTLFGYQQLRGDTAILLESPLDCVRLASVGIAGGVASYGAYVSDAQMRLLRRRVERVVLALDNDTAGRAGRDRVYARWRPRGIRMKFLDYSGTGAKDVGDMEDREITAAVANAHAAYTRPKGA